jgi:hypothetical protein
MLQVPHEERRNDEKNMASCRGRHALHGHDGLLWFPGFGSAKETKHFGDLGG